MFEQYMQLHVSLSVKLPGTVRTVIVDRGALLTRHVGQQFPSFREVLPTVDTNVILLRVGFFHMSRQQITLFTIKTASRDSA